MKKAVLISLTILCATAGAKEQIPTKPGWYGARGNHVGKFRPIAESFGRHFQQGTEDAFDDATLSNMFTIREEKVDGSASDPWQGVKKYLEGYGGSDYFKTVVYNKRLRLIAVGWSSCDQHNTCDSVVRVTKEAWD